ncbi:MAG: septal ring lytic transglycosylase RlpA family protein [Betaproteobacteria bacterium]|nr:MAG: septal ring lytic transglycosylase RlpA family protein [Betaproteobacteria bacterium]
MNNNFGFGNVLSHLSTIPTPASWPIAVIALIFLVSCNTLRPDTSPQTSSSIIMNKGGGYYLDDGPGDNPPSNLASIPNAIPRIEPLRKSNMQPYIVLGKTYTPMTALGPYKKRGIASWYGRRYHGKKTASGEIYDMYGMTAAHTTLPLPSYAQVTNIKNKKSVVVRINDRGPFLSNRLIDLSYTAAYKLDVLSSGSAWVEVESILPGKTATKVTIAPPASALTSGDESASNTIVATSDTGRIYLQLAAFSAYNSADTFLARMRTELPELANALGITAKDGLFKVHAGPYSDQILARQVADKISQNFSIRPIFLVR